MGNNKNDFLLFLAIIVGIGIAWAAGGGPERAQEKQAASTDKQTAIIQETNSAGNNPTSTSRESIEREIEKVRHELEAVQKELEDIKAFGEDSPYKGKVVIEKNASGARETAPSREYVVLRASSGNDETMTITGWKLESTISRKTRTIGNGSYLPNSGKVNSLRAIALARGERAYVVTGRSPVGVSFRANTCTGYFAQFQDFTPPLAKTCPSALNELRAYGNVPATDDPCNDYISTIPRCTMPLTEKPLLSEACFNFLSRHVHYNGCVVNHRNDADFYKPEWRIYLGRGEEQWRERREVIRLLDTNDRIVDIFTY